MASGLVRRDFLKQGSALAWSAMGVGVTRLPASGQGEQQRPNSLVSPPAQSAIDKGLAYLAKLQNEDGTFGRTDFSRNVGVCSFAGLAWLSHGSTPGIGTYGDHTQRCVDYAMECCRSDGFIRSVDTTDRRPMYGHGFATMLLCLTHGMTKKSAVNRAKISAAIKIIVSSQNEAGGWRYEPQRADADVSVTACQMTALRAAKNAGFYVPKAVVDRAIEFIQSCQNADGGFAYQPREGQSEFARTAAAVVALYGAGLYEGPATTNGLSYLHATSGRGTANENHEYFYYGIFYAAQVMWQAGNEHWQRWFPPIRDLLVRLQKQDGSWMDPVGPSYATAIALIVLQMENGYVPLFQK